jgi:hypothetical protein
LQIPTAGLCCAKVSDVILEDKVGQWAVQANTAQSSPTNRILICYHARTAILDARLPRIFDSSKVSLMRFHFASANFVIIAFMVLATDGRSADTAELRSDLRTAEGIGVKYYLSLPKDWTPESTWPILVTISPGQDSIDTFKNFVGSRRKTPFIIVAPCLASKGRKPEDLDSVLAIVKEVQKSSKGQQKFFITGFSAGGHLAWQCIFLHPELLAGGAPASANFGFRGITHVSKAPERVKLPIHGFLGDNDAYKQYLGPQWEEAAQYARENGYENIAVTNVRGAGHDIFADRVVEFFASLLPQKGD